MLPVDDFLTKYVYNNYESIYEIFEGGSVKWEQIFQE